MALLRCGVRRDARQREQEKEVFLSLDLALKWHVPPVKVVYFQLTA